MSNYYKSQLKGVLKQIEETNRTLNELRVENKDASSTLESVDLYLTTSEMLVRERIKDLEAEKQ